MSAIEVIPWVKFNKPGIKEDVEQMVESCASKMDFVSKVKIKYDLSLADANVVANKFYQKKGGIEND